MQRLVSSSEAIAGPLPAPILPHRLPHPGSLTRVEKLCLLLSVVVAHLFYVHSRLYPSCCDAHGYIAIARQMLLDGPFSKYVYSDLRTYGDPLLLSFVMRAADAIGMPFALAIFELQLVLYIGAALLLRAALCRRVPQAAVAVFCGLALNYYGLLYTTDTLTDGLSLILVLDVTIAWLWLRAKPQDDRPLVAGSLLAGFTLMVRPANVYLVAAWLAGTVLALARLRRDRGTMAARVLAATALVAAVALPQLVSNARYYNVVTPFVATDLGRLQQIWGVQYLKYGTAMTPPGSSIFYPNPLYRGERLDPQLPALWYAEHPVRGLATLGLHAFNLTDQDLLFTYSYDLDPWYRVPLGIVNHAIVALGLLGLALLGWAVRRAPTFQRDACAMLGVLLLANLAVHVPTAVEMRFGLVLLSVLFPAAIYGARRLLDMPRVRRGAGVAAVGLYVVLALSLSQWVREQSPEIRAAMATASKAHE